MNINSRTQGAYRATAYDCAVIGGSSQCAKSIHEVVKGYLNEKFPDDYPYFYNKNLTKKLDEERIK